MVKIKIDFVDFLTIIISIIVTCFFLADEMISVIYGLLGAILINVMEIRHKIK